MSPLPLVLAAPPACRATLQLGAAEASRRFAGAEVGRGLRGPAVRYTDLKPAAAAASGAATDNGQDGSGARLDPVSPRAVTAAASAGAAAPEAGTTRAGLTAPPLLPEFGLRYTDATETIAAGVHASPFAPYPTKAWLVGTANGTLNAGMQIATTADRLRAKPGTGKRVDVSFAASIAQPPLFELSLSYDGARREVVAGFVQSMTVRRKCHNLFEEANVKGIYNYVDLGFEVRSRGLRRRRRRVWRWLRGDAGCGAGLHSSLSAVVVCPACCSCAGRCQSTAAASRRWPLAPRGR